MATTKKRATIIPDHEALAVVGYDLATEEYTGPINGSVRVAARLIAAAARELDDALSRKALSRSEWNAIADVMNGCADLYDYGGIEIPALTMIVANLQDCPEIESKWGISLFELTKRLKRMTPAHGEAILAAVRWFWTHSRQVNHLEDAWWEVEYRKPAGEGGE